MSNDADKTGGVACKTRVGRAGIMWFWGRPDRVDDSWIMIHSYKQVTGVVEGLLLG